MLYLKHPERKLRHFIAMPLIFSMIIPIVIMDGWIEIYHRVAFYMYDIPYIKRRQYIKLDRHRLQYLSWPQKLYCTYCGYGNGAVRYWTQIAAATEKYWCGVMHNNDDLDFITPTHHKEFAKYADEQDFKAKYL